MIRKHKWIFFVAGRYLSQRQRKKASFSSLLAVLGISTGVLALLVILAVMNGFQLGFIETILEVSSYHVRAQGKNGGELPQDLLNSIQELDTVQSLSPFIEFQSLVRGRRKNQQSSLVRGLDSDAYAVDSGLASSLDFESGFFDLETPDSILLGAELARQLGVMLGDSVSLLSLNGIFGSDEGTGTENFTVRGIFRTGFYEYDLSWAIIPLNTALMLEGGTDKLQYGIKINNRWHDSMVIHSIEKLDPAVTLTLSSWRDFNRAFFSALRTEKILMFVLVGLIFIVVGLNIFQAQRRSVLERRDEIGLLRAVGASEASIRMIFTFDGFLIGFTGSSSGTLLGLLIASHIQGFFRILEQLLNMLIALVNQLGTAISGLPFAGSQAFSFFSPSVFYLKEIPSRVLVQDVVIIYLFGLFSAVFAAYLASGKLARIHPAEVLRDE